MQIWGTESRLVIEDTKEKEAVRAQKVEINNILLCLTPFQYSFFEPMVQYYIAFK
jgi:hypothetical protein